MYIYIYICKGGRSAKGVARSPDCQAGSGEVPNDAPTRHAKSAAIGTRRVAKKSSPPGRPGLPISRALLV